MKFTSSSVFPGYAACPIRREDSGRRREQAIVCDPVTLVIPHPSAWTDHGQPVAHGAGQDAEPLSESALREQVDHEGGAGQFSDASGEECRD